MASQLRLFSPDETAEIEFPEPEIRVRLGDLLPLVAMAQRQHFIWLQDFLEDEVAISHDLHEVLMAFRAFRPSA